MTVAKVHTRWVIPAMILSILVGGCSKANSDPDPGEVSQGPGLTNKSVTLGNISYLTNGVFQGAQDGVAAYFAFKNSQGGVRGRILKLETKGDGDCTTNQRLTQSLSPKVFAFVGQTSIYDQCGANELKKNPTIPTVSFTFDPVTAALPNAFSPIPLVKAFATGPLLYGKTLAGSNPVLTGALVQDNPASVQTWNVQKAAMEKLGYKFVYERLVAASDANYTADVVKMRDAGVQVVALTALDFGRVAQVLNNMKQQAWKPTLVSNTGTAYDERFLAQLDPGAGDGLKIFQNVAMFLGGDPSTGVARYLEWMKKTNPKAKADIWAAYGWASAQLFTQALEAAGDQPTRESVLAALKSIHTFDADGLIAPTDPGAHRPGHCYVIVEVKDKKFVRSPDNPESGFRCDGALEENE